MPRITPIDKAHPHHEKCYRRWQLLAINESIMDLVDVVKEQTEVMRIAQTITYHIESPRVDYHPEVLGGGNEPVEPEKSLPHDIVTFFIIELAFITMFVLSFVPIFNYLEALSPSFGAALYAFWIFIMPFVALWFVYRLAKWDKEKPWATVRGQM